MKNCVAVVRDQGSHAPPILPADLVEGVAYLKVCQAPISHRQRRRRTMVTLAVMENMDALEAWCAARERENGAAAPLVHLRLGRLPGLRFPIPHMSGEARR